MFWNYLKVFWNLITEITSSNKYIFFGGLGRFLLYSCLLIWLLNSVNDFCLFLFIIFVLNFFMKIFQSCNYVLECNIQRASTVFRMSVKLWSFITTEFSLAKSFGHKPKLQVYRLTSGLKKCCTAQALVQVEVRTSSTSVATKLKRKLWYVTFKGIKLFFDIFWEFNRIRIWSSFSYKEGCANKEVSVPSNVYSPFWFVFLYFCVH